MGGDFKSWISELTSEHEDILLKQVQGVIQKDCVTVLIEALEMGECSVDLRLKANVADNVVPMCLELMKSGAVDLIVIYAWAELATKEEATTLIGSETLNIRRRIFSSEIKTLKEYAQKYQISILLVNPRTGSRNALAEIFDYPFLTTI